MGSKMGPQQQRFQINDFGAAVRQAERQINPPSISTERTRFIRRCSWI